MFPKSNSCNIVNLKCSSYLFQLYVCGLRGFNRLFKLVGIRARVILGFSTNHTTKCCTYISFDLDHFNIVKYRCIWSYMVAPKPKIPRAWVLPTFRNITPKNINTFNQTQIDIHKRSSIYRSRVSKLSIETCQRSTSKPPRLDTFKPQALGPSVIKSLTPSPLLALSHLKFIFSVYLKFIEVCKIYESSGETQTYQYRKDNLNL